MSPLALWLLAGIGLLVLAGSAALLVPTIGWKAILGVVLLLWADAIFKMVGAGSKQARANSILETLKVGGAP